MKQKNFLEKLDLGIKDKNYYPLTLLALGVRTIFEKLSLRLIMFLKFMYLTPDNYRPCALLGAIYMETRRIRLDMNRYEKASERSTRTIDRCRSKGILAAKWIKAQRI